MLTPRQIEWAAGFLEGEGCFYFNRGARITVAQVQRQPVEKLQQLFGGSIQRHDPHIPNHSVQNRWSLHGVDAAGLMMTVYGLMSPGRKEQIRKALKPWHGMQIAAKHRSHCPNGHPYTAVNTEWRTRDSRPGVARRCIPCRKQNQLARYYRTYVRKTDRPYKRRILA